MCVSPQAKTCRARFSGFTLVEVLIAFGVGGVVFVTLYAGLARGFSAVESAHQHLRATQILTEKLEVVRLYSWSQINTPGFIPATFTEYYHPAANGGSNSGIVYNGTVTLTGAVTQTSYSNTIRRVVAQINWVRGGVTNQQRMETFVSQYGVQNFIY